MKVVNSHGSKGPHELGNRYILRTTNGDTSKPYTLTEDQLQWLIELVEQQTKGPRGFPERDMKCTFTFNESDDDGNIYVDVAAIGIDRKDSANDNSPGNESPVGLLRGDNDE